MNIIQSYLTKNDCYKTKKTIAVKGIMLHSVGCNQPSASVFVKSFNKSGLEVCPHAFVDGNTGDTQQTLPWNHRGWHGGGSSNDTHIGIELCEPSQIKYTSGSAFTCSNKAKAKEVVTTTYNAAVELFAYLCEKYNLNPLADGVIISHSEGYKRGVASNHGDVEHLWNGLGTGYTMDGFRKAVSEKMSKKAPAEKEASSNKETSTETSGKLYRVQTGAFRVKSYANNLATKLKASGFSTYIVYENGLYKVQVGAFGVKSNAQAMLAKLKSAGYDGFIKYN